MSTLTFPQQREPALVRSFLLAAIVHVALAAVMFIGVRWQSHQPEVVTVELWEAPPPPRVVEAPKPPPPPPPQAKPEPEPPAPKAPDIVEKKVPPKKAEPKKAEPKKAEPKKAEPKKAEPRRDLDFEKQAREQMAQEQKALDAERKERELKELLARQQIAANQAAAKRAASESQKALAEYISRIQTKVRSNWILPTDLKGNPEAVFNVVQLPTGEVLTVRVVRSSGNAAYDQAVERAILKSSPLPLPGSRELFVRELTLNFRPQDK